MKTIYFGNAHCPYCNMIHIKPSVHEFAPDDEAIICPVTKKLYGYDGRALSAVESRGEGDG